MFDYCTEHYGPLSFYGDGTMKLIEICNVGGGYAAAGASVMGEESFNEQGLKDPLKGAGGSEVLAHEIVHQWWGLGNMFAPESYTDVWSAEGLTVYTTYRMMKEQYGEAYAKQTMWMFGKNRWTIIIKIFMSAIQSIWSGCRNSTVQIL